MWANEERGEMTELEDRRKRAPRSERPGKEGAKEEKVISLLSTYHGPGIVHQMLPWWGSYDPVPFLR